MTFTHAFRVRYAEVDPQKVVFNSRYLEYADILVTEFFRALKMDGLPEGLEFHVRHAEVDYREPLRFDDMVEGRLTVARLGTSSVVLRIALHRMGEGRPAARNPRAGRRRCNMAQHDQRLCRYNAHGSG